MTTEQLLINGWRTLSGDKQKVVLDFIESLKAPSAQGQLNEKETKRRSPPAELIGKVKISGDIVSPIVEEADWECLK